MSLHVIVGAGPVGAAAVHASLTGQNEQVRLRQSALLVWSETRVDRAGGRRRGRR